MRREINIVGIVIWLIVIQAVPELLIGQSPKEGSIDSLHYDTKKIDSLEYVRPWFGSRFVLENGVFFGESHIGVEAVILHPDRTLYAGFFIGKVGGQSLFRDISLYEGTWVGGVALGHQVYLRDGFSPSDQNILEFYFRSGSGLGVGKPEQNSENGTNIYGGFHTQGLIGVQLKLFDDFWFYTQGGGRLLWFPKLEEIGLLGIPIVAVGFRISTNSGLFTY